MVTEPEIEVVILSAGEIGPAQRARLQELVRGELNWDLVIASAIAHKVTPLLYRVISREVPNGLSAEIERRLRSACQFVAVDNLNSAGELDRVCREFERHGIRVLCLKGPTLAAIAYGDLALRQFGDLDILIDEADLERASRLLISKGYRLSVDLSSDQHLYCVARFGATTYSGDTVDVDLHVRLLDERFQFAVTFEELWNRRQMVKVAGGSDCWTISNEDLCLYLAVHGAKHCWQRLSWICDLAFLLQRAASVDWPQVFARARDHGCERILLLGLSLAEQVCGNELPETIAVRCHEDRALERLTHQVTSCLRSADRTIGPIGSVVFWYRCRRRLGEAIRWAAAMTFLPHESDWQRLDLPRPLWFLYSLIRPLRLATTYASRRARK